MGDVDSDGMLSGDSNDNKVFSGSGAKILQGLEEPCFNIRISSPQSKH